MGFVTMGVGLWEEYIIYFLILFTLSLSFHCLFFNFWERNLSSQIKGNFLLLPLGGRRGICF